jgi:hypothetical protein
MELLENQSSKSIKSKGTKARGIKLSPSDLKIADLCARDLWRGINFATGKKLIYDREQVSDERLMGYFAPKFVKLLNGSFLKVHYRSDEIKCFMKICRLNGQFNKGAGFTLGPGNVAIANQLPIYYAKWIKHNLMPSMPHLRSYGVEAIKIIGEEFAIQSRKAKAKIKYKIPFASRLLFFVAPDMMIFNFSTNLSKALRLSPIPIKAMPEFSEIMETALIKHWKELSEFEMPLANGIIADDLWQAARDNGWWQRRVLDLAMLIHFKLVVPRPFLRGFKFEVQRLT